MDTIVDEPGSSLARHIRLEREARGWSLQEMAERSGVAKASISKIERGEMSPTAALLVRLAASLDLTLAGLLLRAEGGGSRLRRRSDQPLWTDPASGYTRRQIFLNSDHPLEMVEVSLPAGAAVDLPASSYARIRQAVWVLEGILEIAEGGHRHRLEPGDCLGFGAPADVRFSNPADHPCRYLVALCRG